MGEERSNRQLAGGIVPDGTRAWHEIHEQLLLLGAPSSWPPKQNSLKVLRCEERRPAHYGHCDRPPRGRRRSQLAPTMPADLRAFRAMLRARRICRKKGKRGLRSPGSSSAKQDLPGQGDRHHPKCSWGRTRGQRVRRGPRPRPLPAALVVQARCVHQHHHSQRQKAFPGK